MKGKIVLALAVVAVAVIASGPVNAACNPSKEFALAYYDSGNNFIIFDPTDDQTTTGAVIGRLWAPGARGTTGDQSAGACDDTTWLLDGDPNQKTIFGSNGADLGTGTCDTSACPAGALIVVVQTKSLDGKVAKYTVGRTLEFSSPNFDFGRSGGNWNMVPMPKPQVTGSSRTATNVTVDVSLAGPDAAFHAAAADNFLSTGTITGYQLVTFTGAADPGRDAALWTNAGSPIATTAPAAAGVVLNCPAGSTVFLANRPVLDGGQFSTDYVSESTPIACSNLATPGTGIKPINKKKSIDQGQK